VIKFSYSQDYKAYGKIFDSKTNKILDYVTVKATDTSLGTTADKDGYYFIHLNAGAHKIIFSYIGYFTDTENVFIEDMDIERNIYLKPSEIMTESIEVLGEDPAYDIIRKAIKYKKLFKQALNEYDYNAYTKYVIRSNQSLIEKDSTTQSEYPILAILESETKGYFKKPDNYKEIVTSKRETANITRGFAIPYIVNFYDENLDLGEVKIRGPLADDALDYYEYKLLGTTSIDSTIVYKIKVDGSGLYPLFEGTIYIADSVFSLMKVDLSLNESTKITAVDKLNFKEKFSAYTGATHNKFWLPSDIQIYADGTFAGIVSFSGDVFTIISSYNINKKAPPGIFDEFVYKVLPDAKKDSTYWSSHQLVKGTDEEKNAFTKIEKKTNENKKKISFGLLGMRFCKYVTSSPLNYYHYNRVEGSSLGFNLGFRSENRRISGDSYFGYGFSDKKSKYEINFSQRLSRDKSLRLEAGFFQKLQPLSFDLPGLFRFTNTLTSLFVKSDYYDYYYTTGYNIRVSKLIVPQFRVSLKYLQEKQSPAFKNTDYSLFKKDQPFRENPLINNAFQRVTGVSFLIDPNKYKFIDYGNGDISRFTDTDFPTLDLGFDYSGKSLGSTFEYRKFSAVLSGQNYVNRFFNVTYRAGAIVYSGDVPVQSLAYFNSSSSFLNKELSFKAMKYREFLGDKLYFLNFENDFGNILWSRVPFFKKLSLIGFFNAGKSEISPSNLILAASKTFTVTDKVYYEAGFGLDGILSIIRLDFAWRLNNKVTGRNFNFSISLDGF